jgi:hypothetical protein
MVLSKLVRVQATLLKVYQEYISSASQSDAFRTEPPFKLQGSYRNMNKLAEKVVAVMNDAELEALVDDHYAGEAQTLTTGAEHNILKLAELRGRLTPEQAKRWEEIKRTFARIQVSGGADEDPVTRLTGHIALLAERVEGVGETIARSFSEAAQQAPEAPSPTAAIEPYLSRVDQAIAAIAAAPRPDGDGAASQRAVAYLAQQFGAVAHRIEALGTVIAKLTTDPSSGAPPSDGAGIVAYLEKLDQTLATLATAPRGGEVVQVLPPGVTELMQRMVASIEQSLLPAVRSIEHEITASQPATDPKMTYLLDTTLKHLDVLKDLATALRKIDTTDLAAPAKRARRPK